MPSPNGTAGLKPLRLGSLIAETRPIEIERNGENVVLTGYVQGKRCPISVLAEVAASRDAWLDARRILDVDGEPVLDDDGNETFRDSTDAAFNQRIKSLLLAVIRGLIDEEAGVLVSDIDLAIETLAALGWWIRPAQLTEDEPEGEASGEMVPESSQITPSSSPDSPLSTVPTTG